MSKTEGFGTLGVVLAFAGGALAGATVAMLFAPVTGEEARKRIKEIAQSGTKRVTRMPKALKSAYSQATDVAKEAFSQAYSQPERTNAT